MKNQGVRVISTLTRSVLMTLTFALTVGATAKTSAEDSSAILDQSQVTSDTRAGLVTGLTIAQTFRPGISGQLDHLNLGIGFNTYFEIYPLTVEIVEAVDGRPEGAVVGRTVFSDWRGQNPDWYSVPCLPQAIFLNSNSVYAVVLTTDSPFYGMSVWSGLYDYYSDGELWTKTSTGEWEVSKDDLNSIYLDFTFQTWMVPGLPDIRLSAPGNNARFRLGDAIGATAVPADASATGRFPRPSRSRLLVSANSAAFLLSTRAAATPANRTVPSVSSSTPN